MKAATGTAAHEMSSASLTNAAYKVLPVLAMLRACASEDPKKAIVCLAFITIEAQCEHVLLGQI